MWLGGYGGIVVRAFATPKVEGMTLGLTLCVTTLGKLFTHKRYNFVRSRAIVLSSWEGNHRCVVTLAMCHRLKWLIYLRAHSLRKGDQHPTYTPRGVWHTLPLPLLIQFFVFSRANVNNFLVLWAVIVHFACTMLSWLMELCSCEMQMFILTTDDIIFVCRSTGVCVCWWSEGVWALAS